MIVAPKVASMYANVEFYLEAVHKTVRETIQPYCEQKGYAIASRIKSLESVSEKIETGRFSAWRDLDDLVAFTVVIPTLAREIETLDYLGSVFEMVRIKQRGHAKKSPDVFRFDSTRFVGRLKLPPLEVRREGIYGVDFEVQVRSAFDHAWVVATHDLTYKGKDISWSRLRLAAQLKAAAEQMDTMIAGFEEASKNLDESVWPETAAMSDVVGFFQDLFRSGAIPAEIEPRDWSRFAQNVFALVRDSEREDVLRPNRIAEVIKEVLSQELFGRKPEEFPRSVSLLQFVFASLAKHGIIQPPLKRYVPVITPELESLCPEVTPFKLRFEF